MPKSERFPVTRVGLGQTFPKNARGRSGLDINRVGLEHMLFDIRKSRVRVG